MQEYKRILTKKLIITVILCMLLNIALFLYGQLEGRNSNIRQQAVFRFNQPFENAERRIGF